MPGSWISLGFVALPAAGLALLGGAAFLAGKYNLLVTLRQKLTGDLREIEFILRTEIEELRNVLAVAGTRRRDQCVARLAEAEQLAHRSAAQKLDKSNLLLLTNAVALFEKCLQDLPTVNINAAGKTMTTGGPTGSVRRRLAGLSDIACEYNTQLEAADCRLMAWVVGFTALELPKDAG